MSSDARSMSVLMTRRPPTDRDMPRLTTIRRRSTFSMLIRKRALSAPTFAPSVSRNENESLFDKPRSRLCTYRTRLSSTSSCVKLFPATRRIHSVTVLPRRCMQENIRIVNICYVCLNWGFFYKFFFRKTCSCSQTNLTKCTTLQFVVQKY